MYCVLYFTLEKKNISDWPKSGPVETGPTGPVATPLNNVRWKMEAHNHPYPTLPEITQLQAHLLLQIYDNILITNYVRFQYGFILQSFDWKWRGADTINVNNN